MRFVCKNIWYLRRTEVPMNEHLCQHTARLKQNIDSPKAPDDDTELSDLLAACRGGSKDAAKMCVLCCW